MTINEINALILDDIKSIVSERVLGKQDPIINLPNPLPVDFNYSIWLDSLFTQTQLDDEFIVYRQELLDIENERLRKKDLLDRFNNLKDMRLTFHSMYPNIPNPALWIRDLTLQDNHADAKSKISALEVQDLISNKNVLKINRKTLMRNNVYDKLETNLGTRRSDTATAIYESAKIFKDDPTYFVGSVAEMSVGTFTFGDTLDTIQKVTNYSDAIILAAKTYAKERNQEYSEFYTELVNIDNG